MDRCIICIFIKINKKNKKNTAITKKKLRHQFFIKTLKIINPLKHYNPLKL